MTRDDLIKEFLKLKEDHYIDYITFLENKIIKDYNGRKNDGK
jgi:hypothetical protein